MRINVAEDNEKYASINGIVYNKDISDLIIWPEGDRSVSSSITLPETLTNITAGQLDGQNLSTIYFRGATPPVYNSNCSNDMLMNTVLHVPKGSLSAYEKATPWRDFWNIEEMDYSGIEDVTDVVDDIEITIVNGIITVNGGNDALMINVYDISGKLIYSGNDNVVEGLNHGMYIVRIGNTVRKVVI